jgi:hypothetical protein
LVCGAKLSSIIFTVRAVISQILVMTQGPIQDFRLEQTGCFWGGQAGEMAALNGEKSAARQQTGDFCLPCPAA